MYFNDNLSSCTPSRTVEVTRHHFLSSAVSSRLTSDRISDKALIINLITQKCALCMQNCTLPDCSSPFCKKIYQHGKYASICSVPRNPKYPPLTLSTPPDVNSICLLSPWLHLVVLSFRGIVTFLSLVSESTEILSFSPALPWPSLGFVWKKKRQKMQEWCRPAGASPEEGHEND